MYTSKFKKYFINLIRPVIFHAETEFIKNVAACDIAEPEAMKMLSERTGTGKNRKRSERPDY